MSLHFPPTLREPWFTDSLASIASRSLSMILRAETPPPMDRKSFHLSFLDQNVVRCYTQTLTIFPVSLTLIFMTIFAEC
jgi:hypothetical protein